MTSNNPKHDGDVDSSSHITRDACLFPTAGHLLTSTKMRQIYTVPGHPQRLLETSHTFQCQTLSDLWWMVEPPKCLSPHISSLVVIPNISEEMELPGTIVPKWGICWRSTTIAGQKSKVRYQKSWCVARASGLCGGHRGETSPSRPQAMVSSLEVPYLRSIFWGSGNLPTLK